MNYMAFGDKMLNINEEELENQTKVGKYARKLSLKSDEIKKQIGRQSFPFREHVLLVISSNSSERGI